MILRSSCIMFSMDKLRIAIDTSYMDRRPGKGTATVIRHIAEELLKYREMFDVTLVHREPIPEDSLYGQFGELIIPRVQLPKFSGTFSELFFFLTTRRRFDVYYFSYSRLLPFFWLAPAKYIVFDIMDGGPQTAGYQGKAKGKLPWYVRLFLWRVDAFVTLSEFGKQGVCKTYGIEPKKVHVAYLGVDERFKPSDNIVSARAHLKSSYNFPERYILCVSRFDPHKNILNLLDAYAELTRIHGPQEMLVFVGGKHMPDYSAQVDERIKKLKLEGKVFIAPYIADEDMPAVYSCALCMVFPSFYEGFGLPVIEAMACKTPVVISNIAALTEVAGSHAFVVDPHDARSIAQGIQSALTDPRREQHLNEARSWTESFTWKNYGKATVEILAKTAKGKL